MSTSDTSFVVVAAKRNPWESLATALSKLPSPLSIPAAVERIIIKPSIFNPDSIGNTTLDLMRAVVAFFRRIAPISIVESDNPVRTAENAFSSCGYDSLVGENVELHNLSENPLVPSQSTDSFLENLEVAEILMKNRFLVNIATLKTQENIVISAGIKNLFGLLPMVRKDVFHDHLSDLLVELLKMFRPVLSIIDLTNLVIGKRENGITRHIGGVILSTDPVALDAYCATLLGYNPLQIDYIRKAYELGLGQALPERIKALGTQHQIDKIIESCRI
ncbi:MAG: DUF362 domain-containing protein [Candidatus Thorarchaeota archaeon]|nr:DUF362 domain-containing protein [Candidatus Thorarchaeota archaeon]